MLRILRDTLADLFIHLIKSQESVLALNPKSNQQLISIVTTINKVGRSDVAPVMRINPLNVRLEWQQR